MKKITLLMMACYMSVMTFAAGGNIVYVLNGGITNDYGWTGKADMLAGFNQDYNTANNVLETATWYTWETLDVILTSADPVVRIPTFAASGFYVVLTSPKWQWLHDYIVATGAAQSIAEIVEADNAFWRYETSAFFVNGKRATWPVSANYAVAGQLSAFIPAWKHAFAGPATYDGSADVTIPDPYKEGFTFDGWYESADFSGAKVTTIPAGTEGDKTLYAKWIEYVPTCAEVWALAAGEATKAAGIVTYVNGTTAYIQDATAGLSVEFAATPDITAGDKITVAGTTATAGTYIKVTAATLSAKETAAVPAAQTIALSDLAADAATYMFEYVYIEGLNITANNGTAATVSDGVNSINLAIALDPGTYPVNSKVNVRAVVSYSDAVILTGSAINVVFAPVPRPDGAIYPVIDGKYKLTSKWLVSNTLDNFSANRIGIIDHVRGMAVQNDKMYFVDRESSRLVVVDGATGNKLDPIVFSSDIFTTNAAGEAVIVGYHYNDIKIDSEGNILVSNLMTTVDSRFQVWKLDLNTRQGRLIVDDVLSAYPDFSAVTARFDAFGVYGNVDGNAIIMAANASAMEVFKWTITDGVTGEPEKVDIDVDTEGTFLTKLANPGTAPQIFPVDENYFYLDGNATLPTLIDMEGNIVDGFYNTEGWAVGNNTGHNGLVEFEVAGEYFFLMASMNTVGTPPSTFTLFKWKDGNKEFKDIELLWTFPAAGMGSVSNGHRTAVPSVEVNEATKTATLYLYTGENGYGVYEFSTNGGSGIKTIHNATVEITAANNQVLLSEKVASIKVYNLMGQLIQKVQGTSSADIANSGIYIVTVQTFKGETVTKKIMVK
jgi:uncharacterized repeat protein (TIGR02543 family)